MKPTTVREALIDYFETVVEKHPEMADKPYILSSEKTLTPRQLAENHDPAFMQELEKGVIQTTIELVVRGKETLPNNGVNADTKEPREKSE